MGALDMLIIFVLIPFGGACVLFGLAVLYGALVDRGASARRPQGPYGRGRGSRGPR